MIVRVRVALCFCKVLLFFLEQSKTIFLSSGTRIEIWNLWQKFVKQNILRKCLSLSNCEENIKIQQHCKLIVNEFPYTYTFICWHASLYKNLSADCVSTDKHRRKYSGVNHGYRDNKQLNFTSKYASDYQCNDCIEISWFNVRCTSRRLLRR